jgi:hypothetical protein
MIQCWNSLKAYSRANQTAGYVAEKAQTNVCSRITTALKMWKIPHRPSARIADPLPNQTRGVKRISVIITAHEET